MKVLHTGDLHIGLSLRRVSRDDEHIEMLKWMKDTIRDESVELLLIAGDVFDCANPPIQAQKIFFDFLSDLIDIPLLKHIVITAGNHDSAGRLQSYCPITAKLGIHIVGAINNRSNDWHNWVIPIEIDGKVQVVVNAIPYLSEYRMGIRWNPENIGDAHSVIRKELKSIYEEMAIVAREKYGNVPLIGMGHLTAMDENYDTGIMPQRIHRIIEKGLDDTVFGSEYCYVALGHIHRQYKVRGSSNAWFCGSPLPCSIAEAEDGSKRGALLFEVADDPQEKPLPKSLVAPVFRQLIRHQEILEEHQVEAFFRNLTWDEPFAPFVYLTVQTTSAARTSHMVNDILQNMHDEGLKVPFIGRVDSRMPTQISANTKEEICSPEVLSDPGTLFEDFFRFKEGQEAPESLKGLFHELLITGE